MTARRYFCIGPHSFFPILTCISFLKMTFTQLPPAAPLPSPLFLAPIASSYGPAIHQYTLSLSFKATFPLLTAFFLTFESQLQPPRHIFKPAVPDYLLQQILSLVHHQFFRSG